VRLRAKDGTPRAGVTKTNKTLTAGIPVKGTGAKILIKSSADNRRAETAITNHRKKRHGEARRTKAGIPTTNTMKSVPVAAGSQKKMNMNLPRATADLVAASPMNWMRTFPSGTGGLRGTAGMSAVTIMKTRDRTGIGLNATYLRAKVRHAALPKRKDTNHKPTEVEVLLPWTLSKVVKLLPEEVADGGRTTDN
jgi:hypothetical protein